MTEQYEFWRMALSSPVGIALASGFIGSILTLIGTLIVLHNANTARDLDWKRQEQKRKEKRIFHLKQHAYEEFVKCFETTLGQGISTYDQKIMPACIRMMMYGPYNIRVAVKAFVEKQVHYSAIDDINKKLFYIQELKASGDLVHTAIMEDIDSHK